VNVEEVEEYRENFHPPTLDSKGLAFEKRKFKL
jgi:hypothetical protein